VRGIGHANRVAVLSRDKTDVSRRGGSEVSDIGKNMADRYLEKMTLLKIMETSEKLQIARYTRLTVRVSGGPAFSRPVFSASLIALTLPLLSSSLRPPCVADADIIFLPCGFLWPPLYYIIIFARAYSVGEGEKCRW